MQDEDLVVGMMMLGTEPEEVQEDQPRGVSRRLSPSPDEVQADQDRLDQLPFIPRIDDPENHPQQISRDALGVLMFGADPDFRGGSYVNTTTAAKHPFGVLYQGPWETLEDGSCRAVRLHARALAATGIPVLLKSFNHSIRKDGTVVSVLEADVDPLVLSETDGLRDTSAADLVPRIMHLVPRSAESLRQLLVPRSVFDEDLARLAKMREALMRTGIIFSVWERDRIPEDIARVMARTGSCWVPCVQNAHALEISGVPADRIQVVPHPFDPGSRLAIEGPQRLPRTSKNFLAVGIWQPRKALHELLGAFLRTFEPGEATLNIKTTECSWPGYPPPQESIRLWMADQRVRRNGWSVEALKGRVRLTLSRLNEFELVDLHLASNIFVSPSHGEAFGLGAFEAKVAGNRLVHVPYGGTADFSEPGDVAIPYRLSPVDPSYRWEEGSLWASYEIEELEDALRKVEPPVDHCRSAWFDEHYSLRVVGEKMARLLLMVADEVHPAASRYLRDQWR